MTTTPPPRFRFAAGSTAGRATVESMRRYLAKDGCGSTFDDQAICDRGYNHEGDHGTQVLGNKNIFSPDGKPGTLTWPALTPEQVQMRESLLQQWADSDDDEVIL